MSTPRTPLPWTPSTILHLALAEDIDFAAHAANLHGDLLAMLKKLLSVMPLAEHQDDPPLQEAVKQTVILIARAEGEIS